MDKPQSILYAPKIKAAGAVYIDNSNAFRLQDDVPLVVPEINGGDALRHSGTISNPNCSTIITMMALGGVARLTKIRKMVASTYQAVSGAGIAGLRELEDQMRAYSSGEPVVSGTFPAQILSNVIPYIGAYDENGYTSEEMKMQNEGRKILHMPDLTCTCTCVRVPVMRSHSISVTFTTEDRLTPEQVREACGSFPGVSLFDNGIRDYPTPLDTTDRDTVMVGRIRRDLTEENGISLWCCGDQIRKGAASNAVQILRYLLEQE